MICFLSGCSKVQRLSVFREFEDNQREKEEIIQSEKESFRRIKSYIEQGKIKEGVFKQYVKENYGEPVITFPEEQPERWVYKSPEQSWFGGEKIYFFFKDDDLLRWKCLSCYSE